MTAFSTYAEDIVINKFLKNDDTYNSPVTVYVALFTDQVADAAELEGGLFTNEIAASIGYDRQAITFTAPSSGHTQNTGLIEFDPATSAWGTVKWAAITDNAARATGNILFFGMLSQEKIISVNDVFKFSAGDLNIDID